MLTRGRISAYFFRSSKVGSQVRPIGGPNSAHVSRRSAIAEVVSLASTDEKAASGGVVKASRPNESSILPRCLSYSSTHFLSRADGANSADDGRADVLATVSRRTSKSFVLLQPQ